MPYSSSTQKRIDNAWRRYREAEREGRNLTAEEQAEIEQAVDASSRERSREAFTKALGGDGPIEEAGGKGAWRPSDPGALFVQALGYKEIAGPRLAAADVHDRSDRRRLARAADAARGEGRTLLEGAGAPGAGSGGGLVPGLIATTLFGYVDHEQVGSFRGRAPAREMEAWPWTGPVGGLQGTCHNTDEFRP